MNNAMADEIISISSGLAPDMPPTLEEDPLELAVNRRLSDGRLGEAGSFTIFRVPAHVRREDRKLYEPRMVSVGPYYRGRAKLRAMEDHKWRYLRHLVQRAAKLRPRTATVAQHATAESLRALVGAIRGVESLARACYSEAAGGDDFAEMLLLDGCFVLEFFLKWKEKEPDALCDTGWALVLLQSDLLLMENQVPFFVLEALFHAVYCGRFQSDRLVKLILWLLKPIGPLLPRQSPCPAPKGQIHHLLHLYYEAYLVSGCQAQPVPQAPQPVLQDQPVPQTPQPDPQAKPVPQALQPVLQAQPITQPKSMASSQASPPPPQVRVILIPSASTLRDSGVRFKRNLSPRDMFHITFDAKRGVMEMPPMAIDQAQLPLLTNLIAFEQSRGRRTAGPDGAPLTSYAALMSSLVRTGKDVEELRGIVDNLLSSDDDAARGYFQSLGACSTLNYNDHLFAPLFADVTHYHEKSWHRYRARFVRDNCSNPWSVIALVLAVLAFFFSLFNQTVSVYNLAHPQQPPAPVHG